MKPLQRMNIDLVGALEEEYKYETHTELKDFLSLLYKEYCFKFNIAHSDPKEFQTWANYQKKHEYNQLHLHGGAMS